MRSFENYNPIAVASYIFAVSGIAMFCMNPVLLSTSLFGAILLFIVRNGRKQTKSHFAFLGLFLVMSFINPLFNHNGATVLFMLNDSRITLEALVYGAAASGMVIAVLYWFRSFTQIMTSDKLLYLFGKISPKLALVLSMGIRYVSLFQKQAKKINGTQIALGLYKDDNIIDQTRGGLRVFSVMLTWALENGIVTADSMAARGYGIGKRTHFSIFRFRKEDVLLMLVSLILTAITCISLGAGALDVTFYPKFAFAEITTFTYIGYISYALLVLIPIFIETGEKIRWKYLKSKI